MLSTKARHILCALLALIIGYMPLHAFRIVSYNVENFFYPESDSMNTDTTYTPSGTRRWSYVRYQTKQRQIARVIADIGGMDGAGLVGLMEVESDQCLHDLCQYNMRALGYDYVHYDSPDARGIDVALLYRPDLFKILDSKPIAVDIGSHKTRDLLYAKGLTQYGDTMHIMVCHLPSKLSGVKISAERQTKVKAIIQQLADSILRANSDAHIVVMGDMNNSPKQDIAGLQNKMQGVHGTYKYHGDWSTIDQFYVSPAVDSISNARVYTADWLLEEDERYEGKRPKRTYSGFRYIGGCSDHLPIILDITDKPTKQFTMAEMPLESILQDIWQTLSENGETDFEELTTDLINLADEPINLNQADYAALQRLPFLSEQQITDILLAVHDEPLHSVYELLTIPSLRDYEVRDLLPFVTVGPAYSEPIYWREVFVKAQHELLTRIDARNVENFSGSDPIFVQQKYAFNYRQQVQAGLNLRRPAGANAGGLQVGGYVQLTDIGRTKHANDNQAYLKRMVLGNYQARFGQGLVTSGVFHLGANSRTMEMGAGREGLQKFSSAGDYDCYHGIGATIRAHSLVDVSAWYSIRHDQTYGKQYWHHAIGANITMHWQQLHIGLAAVEHLYSDSVPVQNNYYNQSYFRGNRQAVGGVNFRYGWRKLHVFGELAAAQNDTIGWAVIAGARLMATPDLGLVALYRYYSPTFDNKYGYAFAEGSRLGDENGGWLGIEYKGIQHWRLSAYGDVFRFARPKYGIRQAGTVGYQAFIEADWLPQHEWSMLARAKAKRRGNTDTYQIRYQLNWNNEQWRVRGQIDANIVQIENNNPTYGLSVLTDIEYHIAVTPIVIQLRLQGFDARNWNNRIYAYENDVLYAFSMPATYGAGGRMYVNMRYLFYTPSANSRVQALKQGAVYLKLSETIYQSDWANNKSIPRNRTDIHMLLRLKF